MSKIIYDCLIIGGGPAGLSAALYAARSCLKIALIEKEYVGGKLNKTLSIENYPGYTDVSGMNLGDKMHEQLKGLEVNVIEKEVVGICKKRGIWNLKLNDNTVEKSRTILIASGMKERVLDIPNIREYYGKGVSYCAICDGNIYAKKEVIVVGGGNSAVEESIYLSKLASKVKLVHRRKEFTAEEITVRKMKKIKNIEINTPYFPIEVKVKDNKVIGLVVEHSETHQQKLIRSNGIFFYVGLIPENYFLKNLSIDLDEWGFIKVDKHMKTNIPTIYAAGDVVHKHLRQVATATSDGCIAAIAIKDYIESLKN